MRILTLDLSKVSTGWAVWQSGWSLPRYGSWTLGSPYTPPGAVFAKLHHNLSDLRAVMSFDVIYHEEAIDARNLSGNTNIKALRLASGLAAHVESFAYATGCRAHAINVSTWRKDFIGEQMVKDENAKARAKRKATGGKASARDALKSLTMERCRQLGMKPANNDQGDAIGILDFALDFHEHVTPPWRSEEVLRPALGGAA